MERLRRAMALTDATRVLDIGGTPFNWSLVGVRPRLVLLNIQPPKHREGMVWIVADAKHLPFRDRAFDVAVSNSVIEHVGTYVDQKQFANECRRAAERYAVQTPNRTFPIEPHVIAPFFQWLPARLQYRLMRNFTVRGLVTRPTREESRQFLLRIRLLDAKEMRQLFPDAMLWRERFLGLTKSLIAIRE